MIIVVYVYRLCVVDRSHSYYDHFLYEYLTTRNYISGIIPSRHHHRHITDTDRHCYISR
jgi:hypothetical protein